MRPVGAGTDARPPRTLRPRRPRAPPASTRSRAGWRDAARPPRVGWRRGTAHVGCRRGSEGSTTRPAARHARHVPQPFSVGPDIM